MTGSLHTPHRRSVPIGHANRRAIPRSHADTAHAVPRLSTSFIFAGQCDAHAPRMILPLKSIEQKQQQTTHVQAPHVLSKQYRACGVDNPRVQESKEGNPQWLTNRRAVERYRSFDLRAVTTVTANPSVPYHVSGSSHPRERLGSGVKRQRLQVMPSVPALSDSLLDPPLD